MGGGLQVEPGLPLTEQKRTPVIKGISTIRMGWFTTRQKERNTKRCDFAKTSLTDHEKMLSALLWFAGRGKEDQHLWANGGDARRLKLASRHSGDDYGETREICRSRAVSKYLLMPKGGEGRSVGDAPALRNVCRRSAICDFLNNGR